jgi:hypothetical protein
MSKKSVPPEGQNSEQTRGLAGSSSHVLLAVVDEIRREMPRYGPPSATAKVILFDGMGGQTCVEIPVLSIVNQLDHVSRYVVEIKFRPMAPDERFDPANAGSDLPPPSRPESKQDASGG